MTTKRTPALASATQPPVAPRNDRSASTGPRMLICRRARSRGTRARVGKSLIRVSFTDAPNVTSRPIETLTLTMCSEDESGPPRQAREGRSRRRATPSAHSKHSALTLVNCAGTG